jgi:hypothetical protein
MHTCSACMHAHHHTEETLIWEARRWRTWRAKEKQRRRDRRFASEDAAPAIASPWPSSLHPPSQSSPKSPEVSPLWIAPLLLVLASFSMPFLALFRPRCRIAEKRLRICIPRSGPLAWKVPPFFFKRRRVWLPYSPLHLEGMRGEMLDWKEKWKSCHMQSSSSIFLYKANVRIPHCKCKGHAILRMNLAWMNVTIFMQWCSSLSGDTTSLLSLKSSIDEIMFTFCSDMGKDCDTLASMYIWLGPWLRSHTKQ